MLNDTESTTKEVSPHQQLVDFAWSHVNDWRDAARLVEVAPELLAAAKDALDYLHLHLGQCEFDCECVQHPLRAAINKAEGRS